MIKYHYKLICTICLMLHTWGLWAQDSTTLTLEQCYQLARENHPLSRQRGLISQSAAYTSENISKAYLPQVSLGGQATYQSAVTQIPIKLPGLNIESLSKDQYKIYTDISQILFDGGVTKQQKTIQESNSQTEVQKLEAELYKLKEQVNQVYFGILLLDEQLEQTELIQADIQNGIDKVSAGIRNGVMLEMNEDILKVEMLKLKQRVAELHANRSAFMQMLGLLINKRVPANVKLTVPEILNNAGGVHRPELNIFTAQQKTLSLQYKLLQAKNTPRFGAFIQTGYGRPALNMLDNSFQFYYIGGVRFSWQLSNYYTLNKEKQLLEINRNMLDIQKDNFLFNTSLQVSRQEGEINKIKDQLTYDEQIISIREKIKKATNSQLQNGTANSNDYIREVSAEDQARQMFMLHRLQLLMAQYQQQFTQGN